MLPLLIPKQRYSKDQVSSLAATIGYAVEHGIPVENALNSLLPPTGTSIFYGLMRSPFAAGMLYPIFRNRASYYHGIRQTILSLHKGLSLPDCLDTHLAKILPIGYRTGVRVAFDSGKQEELLPKLATAIDRSPELPSAVNYTPIFLAYLTIILTITSGFMTFIAPKFSKMMDEMCEGAPLPSSFRLIIYAADLSIFNTLWLVLTFTMAVYFLYRFVFWIFSIPRQNRVSDVIGGFWNDAMKGVPILGDYVSDKLQLEAVQMTYGCLLAEMSLIESVDYTAVTMQNSSLRRRMRRFADKMRHGVECSAALQESKAWDPFTRWILLAGLQRDGLKEAFCLQFQFLSERCNRRHRFWNKASAVFFILLLGGLVGLMVYGMFEPMARMVEHLAGFTNQTP